MLTTFWRKRTDRYQLYLVNPRYINKNVVSILGKESGIGACATTIITVVGAGRGSTRAKYITVIKYRTIMGYVGVRE